MLKTVHHPVFLLRLLWILSTGSLIAQLAFQRGKWNYSSFHLVKNSAFLWWVLTLVYLPLTAIQRRCDSRWRLLPRPRKLFFFFFCICQVFNANLPLLVTSAFPSSRLLLFSLKRLWSPTDPGDLHRTSLVKCLGWIRRDGWGKEGSSPIYAHFPLNHVGKRRHPAEQIDS